MERVRTGVSGLDKMLNGGLIKNRAYVISGGPGSGKTIFSLHFLKQGVEEGENCLFLSLEEPKKEIKNNVKEFGWKLEKIRFVDVSPEVDSLAWDYSSAGMLSIKQSGNLSKKETSKGDSFKNQIHDMEFSFPNVIKILDDEIEKYNHKRIVIDSLTSFRILGGDEKTVRIMGMLLMKYLSDRKITSLLTLSLTNNNTPMVESFLSRGEVRFHIIEEQRRKQRAVEIIKMRGTAFDDQFRPMKISNCGIEVYPDESIIF